jgi:quinol monooxygenase YgiN
MTCIVILEVTAKKGAGMQLVETFRALLPDTRNKDGCQGVEVTTNLDNADNLVLVQRWATRKHYENYLDRRQQRGDVDKLVEASAGPPSIRYFRPDERVSPLGRVEVHERPKSALTGRYTGDRRMRRIGRVGVWRSGCRSNISVAAPFV